MAFKDILYLVHHIRQSDMHLYEALHAINTSLFQLFSTNAPAVTVSGGSGGGTRVQVTITGLTNINVAVTADGSLMVLEIKQDGTGGHGITWGANFETGISTIIGPNPNQITAGLFYSNGTIWRLIAGFEYKT